MSRQITIELSQDGWTGGLQLSINETDERGSGHGHRIFGPKFNGSSVVVKRCRIDAGQAREIRSYLDRVAGSTESSVTAGAERIAAERRRQVEAHGWTSERDDEHASGELAIAGACYAVPGEKRWMREEDDHQNGWVPSMWPEWPFEPGAWKPSPEDRVRELVKAGALIAAEIDRLIRQRAA